MDDPYLRKAAERNGRYDIWLSVVFLFVIAVLIAIAVFSSGGSSNADVRPNDPPPCAGAQCPE